MAPIETKKMPAYTGVAAFLTRFQDPQTSELPADGPIEILKPSEIRTKKRKRQLEEHEEEMNKKIMLCTPLSCSIPLMSYFSAKLASYSHKCFCMSRLIPPTNRDFLGVTLGAPHDNPKATEEAYSTLFVSRLVRSREWFLHSNPLSSFLRTWRRIKSSATSAMPSAAPWSIQYPFFGKLTINFSSMALI